MVKIEEVSQQSHNNNVISAGQLISTQLYISKNKVLKDNKIFGENIVDQVRKMPPPKSKTKSGYPHKYENHDDIFSIATVSSTRSFYELPVKQSGHFNFDKKISFR